MAKQSFLMWVALWYVTFRKFKLDILWNITYLMGCFAPLWLLRLLIVGYSKLGHQFNDITLQVGNPPPENVTFKIVGADNSDWIRSIWLWHFGEFDLDELHIVCPVDRIHYYGPVTYPGTSSNQTMVLTICMISNTNSKAWYSFVPMGYTKDGGIEREFEFGKMVYYIEDARLGSKDL